MITAGAAAQIPVLGAAGRFRIDTFLTIPDDATLILDPDCVFVRNNDTTNHAQATLINADTTNGNSGITIIGGLVESDTDIGGVHFRLVKCTDVRLTDLYLGQSEGTWQMILDQCEDLYAENLRIINPIALAGDGAENANNDGLHLRGGKRMQFVGGTIQCGDDAIALGYTAGNVIEFGFEDISFTGMHLDSRTNHLFRIERKDTADTAYDIKRIRISNITGQSGQVPLTIKNDAAGGVVEDVVVSGFTATIIAPEGSPDKAMAGIQVVGADDIHVSGYHVTGATAKGNINLCTNVSLRDSTINGEDLAAGENVLNITSSSDVKLDDVTAEGGAQHGITIDDCDNVTLEDCKTRDMVRGVNVVDTTGACSKVHVIRHDAGGSNIGAYLDDLVVGSVRDCDLTGCTTGVDFRGAASDVAVHDNDFTGTTTKVSPASTYAALVGSRISVKRNKGYATEAQGTATLANGGTSIAVTHGLAVTPNAQDIRVHPIESLGNATFWYVDTITSTQFTIRVDADPGADVDFAWRVEAY
jgi:hypothetical protein